MIRRRLIDADRQEARRPREREADVPIRRPNQPCTRAQSDLAVTDLALGARWPRGHELKDHLRSGKEAEAERRHDPFHPETEAHVEPPAAERAQRRGELGAAAPRG